VIRHRWPGNPDKQIQSPFKFEQFSLAIENWRAPAVGK
jgi:hypothetical protein